MKKLSLNLLGVILMNLVSVFIANSQTVTPYFTTGDQTKLIAPQPTVNFGANSGTNPSTITITPATTYQSMDGFGYTMTEGSAEVISGMADTQQNALLNEIYNPTTGLGVAVMRISIGASDLSSSNYSYNDVDGDVNMTNFSLAGPDLTYLIPIIKKVLLINPNIKILATPWSPPKWMKSNDSYVGGNLNASSYAAYANYFVKYFQAMQAQGINIWAITPQNEPENPFNNPSMLMNSTEQKNFINNNLGSAMASAGFGGIKIIAFDHNCDNTAYPIDVLNNSTYVDGAAFHLYAGNISAMTTVRNATNKNVYFTEQYTGSGGNFAGDFAWHTQNVLHGSVNNWSKAVFEWNLANNASIGPFTAGGCNTCLGAITINSSTSYTRNVAYYILGQVSKFVKPGALRIASSSSSATLTSAAFRNPDGSIVVSAYNAGTVAVSMKVVNGSQSFTYSLPATSSATYVWSTGPPVAVTGVSVSPISATVLVNNSTQLTATVSPANASNQSVTWISSNTAVASVNSSGLVSGVTAGSAVITVMTVDGNKTATSNITVNVIATTGVSVSPTTSSIFATQTTQLTASVLPANASNKNVTWTSSNTAIATVNASGLVTGIAQGTATITVKTVSGNFTANTAITIRGQEPYSGTPSPIPGVIQAENYDKGGQNIAYNDTDATNNGGAYRPSEGVDISTIGTSTTQHTLGWTVDGEWIEYTTNVMAGTYSVLATVATPTSGHQMVVKLDGVILTTVNIPNTGGYGTFQTVTIPGIVFTGGTNKVLRLEIVGGDFNIDKIEVKSVANIAVTSVAMSPTSASVGVGSTTQLTATVAPANATNKSVTWSSSNTGVATVNASGVVSGVAIGTATITVTTADGAKTATCAITVVAVSTSFPGYYNILSRNSGKGLDVANNATNSGAGVQQYDIANGGGSNQRWKFVSAGGNNYNIIVKSSLMCLAPSATGNVNGEKVQQRTCGTGNQFKWTVTALGAGFYKIINLGSGKSLDVENVSTANGALIQVWDYSSGNNQQWSFTQVESSARVSAENYEDERESFEFFPNPTNDFITVKSTSLRDYNSISILNTTGMAISNQPVNEGVSEQIINLKTLNSGLYFLRLNGEGKSIIQKIIKQ